MQSFIQKVKKFIAVNIWVEKLHIRGIGWFYGYEIFYNLYNRIYSLIDTFFVALILNAVISHIGDVPSTIEAIKIPVIAMLINRFFVRVLQTNYWRERYIRRNFAFDQYFNKMLMTKLDELNWEHIETPETEKHLNITFNRSRGNMEDLSRMHIDILSVLVALQFTIMTVKISWWIYLIVLIKELPSIILHSHWNTQSYRISDKLHPIHMRLGSVGYYFRHYPTLFEVKLTRAKDQLMGFRENFVKTIIDTQLKHNKKMRLPQVLLDLYEISINTGIYLYYVFQVITRTLELGTFQYVTTAVRNLGDHIYNIISQIPRSVEAYRYIRFAYDILRLQNATPNGTKQLTGEHITIEFRHVWFKYPNAHKFALKDVSFTIKDNDRIALVGENGAGKSTFLKLLMMVYYPTRGDIFINGTRLQEYDKNSIYQALSLVTQEFARYDAMTVRENIAITEPTARISQPKILKAAKLADAHSFIKRLKHGYDTLLTKQLPEGTELSTGQWQRIAVARQFYANRPLIVLDEPTSAIDPIAEAKIFSNLYEQVKDKTVIVVSHRYNTVRAAKKILVFNNGQIIEQGNHDELIKLNGYYAKAFAVQHEVKKL